MNKKLFLGIALSLAAQAIDAQTIRYVKIGGAGTKDGLSWANASDNLQAMLDASVVNSSNPSQSDIIYIAKGTYYPTALLGPKDVNGGVTTARDKSFNAKSGTSIYGGFAGIDGETIAARDLANNKTILSGDIDGNDVIDTNGIITGNDNNSYHVLTVASQTGIFNTMILDGLNITGGNANGTFDIAVGNVWLSRGVGGGIYMSSAVSSSSSSQILNANPTIRNCAVLNNAAPQGSGGGIYINASSTSFNNSSTATASPQLSNCLVANNRAAKAGGIYINSSTYSTSSTTNPTFYNCTIANNTGNAAGDSGGLSMIATSGQTGGAMVAPQIFNTIFWGNNLGGNTTASGSDFYIYGNNGASKELVLVNSLLQLAQGSAYSFATLSADTNNKYNVDPKFISATNFQLTATSPAVNSGNNNTRPPGTSKDIIGKNRVIGGTVDMGAYEFDPAAMAVVEANGKSDITIYPNPVTDVLNVKIDDLRSISIYSSDGKLLFTTDNAAVNVSALPKGIYIISAKNKNNENLTKKFIKK